MSNTRTRFSPEVRARAVRMVIEHQSEHTSRWAAIEAIAPKIGCAAQTVRTTPIESKYLIPPDVPAFPPPGTYGASDIRARLCVPALADWVNFGLTLKDKVEVRQGATTVIEAEEERLRDVEGAVLDGLDGE